jgi:hypothetical protein
MSILKNLWSGVYPLPKAFWGAYVLGGLFFAGLVRPVILLISYRFHVGTIGFIIATVLVYGYISVATVGVWRSAKASLASPIWMVRAWAIAARSLVFLWTVGFLWWLYNGGAQALMQRMTAPMDF